MLRHILLHPERNILKLSLPSTNLNSALVRKAHSNSNILPAAPQLCFLTSPEETDEARSWISRFKSQPISRGSVELSFSRSSGPGGQVRIRKVCCVLILGLNFDFQFANRMSTR
jgi:peptidyl-tRNA hydrolase ICT1